MNSKKQTHEKQKLPISSLFFGEMIAKLERKQSTISQQNINIFYAQLNWAWNLSCL